MLKGPNMITDGFSSAKQYNSNKGEMAIQYASDTNKRGTEGTGYTY